MVKFFLVATICLCSILQARLARATNFSLNPIITFEVGDGFSGQPLDGRGDANAVFPGNFDTVVLNNFIENSENAEFDLSKLSIPMEETITKVTFQVTTLPNLIYIYDSEGTPRKPSSLVVRGYIGNGQPDASNFQAGTILDTAKVSPEFVEEILNFNVTSFVQNMLNSRNNILGFGIRAQSVGGIVLDQGRFSGNGPTLIISTASKTTTVPEPSLTLGILACAFLGKVILNRR